MKKGVVLFLVLIVSISIYAQVLPDADTDGMPDAWETKYSSVMQNETYDADRDPDGDLLLNIMEYRTGADPSKPDTDGDS
ncbi:MAG: polysaccharide lyase, partial [Nanoarchaeota archaeon]|nr:polysaccharide lyase [Nanoarchaeota archaeon]